MPKTMKAPAVGTSSKAMCRRNSSGVRHTPDGPLTCTAATSLAPQSFSTCSTRTPNGIFVESRPRAIAGHGKDLRAGRVLRAASGEHPTAMQRDLGRLGERLDIVDHRRLAEIAHRHREGRPNARLARLALEQFDQRQFFAADVGAGAEMNLDVEIESLRPADASAQAGGRVASRRASPQAVPGDSGTRRADREARASPRRRSPAIAMPSNTRSA